MINQALEPTLNLINIKRILIIRLSSIGDVLLATPLIRLLKRKYPESNIDFLVSSSFSEILGSNPYISNVLEYDKSLNLFELLKFKKALKKQLTKGKYDVIVDLQRNLRSLIFRFGIGRIILKVKKYRLNKLSLIYFKKPILKIIMPVAEVYIDALKQLNVSKDNKGLEFWLPEEKQVTEYPPDNRQISSGGVKIALAPGAHHFTKRWPVHKYSILAKELKAKFDCEIVLIGGVVDKETCRKIVTDNDFKIEDFSGSNSIIETVKKIDECRLVITNDTGVMHIAAARRKPIVAIFGSTVKNFGFSPYKTKNIIVEKDVPCRPCTHIGKNHCPKGHFNCMNLINVEDILDAIVAIMKQE